MDVIWRRLQHISTFPNIYNFYFFFPVKPQNSMLRTANKYETLYSFPPPKKKKNYNFDANWTYFHSYTYEDESQWRIDTPEETVAQISDYVEHS